MGIVNFNFRIKELEVDNYFDIINLGNRRVFIVIDIFDFLSP